MEIDESDEEVNDNPDVEILEIDSSVLTRDRARLVSDFEKEFPNIDSRRVFGRYMLTNALRSPSKKSNGFRPKRRDIDPTAFWFDDVIVQKYFESLEKKYPGVAYIDSMRSTNLEYTLNQFKLGIRNQNPRYLKYQQANTILFPLFMNGNHFGLLVIKRFADSSVSISCLDPFNLQDQHTEYLEFGVELSECIFGSSDVLAFDSIRIPEQPDGENCGPGTCFFALRSCLNDNFSAYAKYSNYYCDYSLFRWDVAKSILESQRLEQEPEPIVTHYRMKKSPPNSPTKRKVDAETNSKPNHDSNAQRRLKFSKL